jgi:MOSC domain-containing protein
VPTLARINIHPVKSFDPQPVDEAVLLASGALENDRRFAICDHQGEFINAKRTPAVHRLRSAFDPATSRLGLRIEGTSKTHVFDVASQRRELELWLGDYFDIPLKLVENRDAGFPDDTESPGPTVISTATLAEVAGWFPGLTTDEVRDRFRANLEIDGVEAFWEDRLVAEGTRMVRFQIGDVALLGSNPCQRCPVPTRNPYTGEAIREFAKIFSSHREQSLREWAPASRFDHFYRLATNTRPYDSEPRTLRVGDLVRVLGVV